MNCIVSLWSSSSFWEGVEYIAESIVVAGALVECLADFEHILRGDDKKDLRKWVEKLAAVALVIGLSVGVVALVRTNQLSSEAIATAYGQAKVASDKATLAQDRADKAETHAAEVAHSVAPRRLTQKERSEMGSGLLAFRRQPVVAIHNTFDAEASVFASEILSTLETARWNTAPLFAISGTVSSVSIAPAIPETGILVQSTTDEASQRASEALVDELRRSGFDCRGSQRLLKGRIDPMILITVESRPDGPQGEANVSALKAKKP